MNWIPLKIYKSEELISEVERVESKYDNLINEVRCSDLDDNQSKIDFLSFREEIEQRIIELEEFYQLNINDSRISTFERVRNRLIALLSIKIDEGNKIMQKYYAKNNEIKIENMNKYKLNGKKVIQRKSKLFLSNSAMRKSSMRKSGTLFGE